jgi:hypothetical protein
VAGSAGTDGIIELRIPERRTALAKLLGVQVKSTESGQYIRERRSFEYLLKPDDLKYWRVKHSGGHCPVAQVRRKRLLEGGSNCVRVKAPP